jgi:hypothetical protein
MAAQNAIQGDAFRVDMASAKLGHNLPMVMTGGHFDNALPGQLLDAQKVAVHHAPPAIAAQISANCIESATASATKVTNANAAFFMLLAPSR